MSTIDARQLWDRLQDESEAAFAAFCVFRDLGPARSVVEAYRQYGGQREGKEGAKQASGRFNRWAGTHQWAARALAWDRQLDQVRHAATEKAVEAAAAKHARLLIQQDNETLIGSQALKLVALQMLQCPIHAVDGQAKDGWRFRDAAYLLLVARELEDKVLRPAQPDASQHQADQQALLPAPTEIQDEAARRVQDYRVRMRGLMLTLPTGPPGKPPDDSTGLGVAANGSGQH